MPAFVAEICVMRESAATFWALHVIPPHQDFAMGPIKRKKLIEMIIVFIGMPLSCQIYIGFKLGILQVFEVKKIRLSQRPEMDHRNRALAIVRRGSFVLDYEPYEKHY